MHVPVWTQCYSPPAFLPPQGLGRKARRHGGIIDAYFLAVDTEKEREKLWNKREAVRLKKERDLAAAMCVGRRRWWCRGFALAV